jgi:hypothetical protein
MPYPLLRPLLALFGVAYLGSANAVSVEKATQKALTKDGSAPLYLVNVANPKKVKCSRATGGCLIRFDKDNQTLIYEEGLKNKASAIAFASLEDELDKTVVLLQLTVLAIFLTPRDFKGYGKTLHI